MEFSKWWVSEFKVVKFPSQGTVFDYLLDGETKKWVHWTEKIPKFELDPEVPLQVWQYVAYITSLHSQLIYTKSGSVFCIAQYACMISLKQNIHFG